MDYWQELTPSQTQRLLVPQEVAENPNNRFFSTEVPYEYWEGAWEFLAVMRHPHKNQVVTIQFCSADFEYLFGENPLTSIGATIIYLNRDSMLGLAYLLRGLAVTLWPLNRENPKDAFKIVTKPNLATYKLPPKVDDYFIVEYEYYLQIDDPLKSSRKGNHYSFAIVSIPHHAITYIKPKFNNRRWRIKFLQFTENDLAQPTFNPVKTYMFNRIDLNKSGLLAVASILEESVSPKEYKFR